MGAAVAAPDGHVRLGELRVVGLVDPLRWHFGYVVIHSRMNVGFDGDGNGSDSDGGSSSSSFDNNVELP